MSDEPLKAGLHIGTIDTVKVAADNLVIDWKTTGQLPGTLQTRVYQAWIDTRRELAHEVRDRLLETGRMSYEAIRSMPPRNLNKRHRGTFKFGDWVIDRRRVRALYPDIVTRLVLKVENPIERTMRTHGVDRQTAKMMTFAERFGQPMGIDELHLRMGARSSREVRERRFGAGRKPRQHNRHDVERWYRRELLPALVVARDMLESGDRGRALAVLCEVVELDDAIDLTRPYAEWEAEKVAFLEDDIARSVRNAMYRYPNETDAELRDRLFRAGYDVEE